MHEIWANYVEDVWLPWQQLDREKQKTSRLYERVYDMYQASRKEAENYEMLLAIGLLSWHTPSSQMVCRHLLTAKTSVGFDTISGTVTVAAPPEGISFQLEQDMLEMTERPNKHHREEHDKLGTLKKWFIHRNAFLRGM